MGGYLLFAPVPFDSGSFAQLKTGLWVGRRSVHQRSFWCCGWHSTASLSQWKSWKRMWVFDVCMYVGKRKKKTDDPVRDEMRSSPGTGQSQYAEVDWVLREDRPPEAPLIQTETARVEEGTELLFVCECVCERVRQEVEKMVLFTAYPLPTAVVLHKTCHITDARVMNSPRLAPCHVFNQTFPLPECFPTLSMPPWLTESISGHVEVSHSSCVQLSLVA